MRRVRSRAKTTPNFEAHSSSGFHHSRAAPVFMSPITHSTGDWFHQHCSTKVLPASYLFTELPTPVRRLVVLTRRRMFQSAPLIAPALPHRGKPKADNERPALA